MTKKILIIVSVVVLIGLVGCSQEKVEVTNTTKPSTTEVTTTTTTEVVITTTTQPQTTKAETTSITKQTATNQPQPNQSLQLKRLQQRKRLRQPKQQPSHHTSAMKVERITHVRSDQ